MIYKNSQTTFVYKEKVIIAKIKPVNKLFLELSNHGIEVYCILNSAETQL